MNPSRHATEDDVRVNSDQVDFSWLVDETEPSRSLSLIRVNSAGVDFIFDFWFQQFSNSKQNTNPSMEAMLIYLLEWIYWYQKISCSAYMDHCEYKLW